jgi:hypothetical protein
MRKKRIMSYTSTLSGILALRCKGIAARRGLLCTLLHQVLQDNHVAIKILEKYPEISKRICPSDWELLELQNILQEAVNLQGRLVCFVLDGLNEMDNGEDLFDLKRIAQPFLGLKSVRCCVSSRPA